MERRPEPQSLTAPQVELLPQNSTRSRMFPATFSRQSTSASVVRSRFLARWNAARRFVAGGTIAYPCRASTV